MRAKAATKAGASVATDDAAARRQRERLEDARIGGGARCFVRVRIEPDQREVWARQAGGCERLAHRVLVARSRDRIRRVVGEPERPGRLRRQERCRFVGGDDGG